jgi:hypothetical protein
MKYLVLGCLLHLQIYAASIAEHYKELSDTLKSPLLSYKLFQKKGQWQAKEVQFEDARLLTPFIQKSYMQMWQETGDGREIIEVKRWLLQNGTPLLGVRKDLHSGGFVEKSETDFFIKKGQRWQETDALPRLMIRDFIPAGMPSKTASVLNHIGAMIVYAIPTEMESEVVVRILVDTKKIERICQNDPSIRVDNIEEYRYYCEQIAGKLLPPVRFGFDARQGTFVQVKSATSILELYQKIREKRQLLEQRLRDE